MKPVIGIDYYPNRTLRTMPPGWVLEESRLKRVHWFSHSSAWLVILTGMIFLTILGLLLT